MTKCDHEAVPSTVRRAALPALVAALALASSGCFWVTTKHEGKQLKKDIKDIEVRVVNYESSLESKLKKLELVLGQATLLLKRNSANLGADVDALQSEMRKMRGLLTAAKKFADDARADVVKLNQAFGEKLTNVTNRMDSIDLRLQTLEKAAANPPKKAADYYRDGQAAFAAGKFDDAITAFKNVAIRFPNHSRADDAQYYRAESHYRLKQYGDAIREFQKVYDRYKSSQWADDSLYRAAEAAEKQKQCRTARVYLAVLRKDYKKSPLARKALLKDRKLTRNLRNRRLCVK